MNMGMHLQLRQELSLAQKLEQRLEQKLEQRMAPMLTMRQYMEREDIIKTLINWTEENNSWAKFDKDGFDFTFARVPYKLAKPLADLLGFGFAHCIYNPWEALIRGKNVALAKGDWTLFVVDDKVPRELQDLVAIHERGEQLSSGDHYFASQLEFAFASKKSKVRPYISFIDKKAPTKFVDLTERDLHSPPQELVDFLKEQNKQNGRELETAQRIINNHPIPHSALRLMTKYEDATQKVCESIRSSIGPIQNRITNFDSIQPSKIKELAAGVDKILRDAVLSVKPKDARGVSFARTYEELTIFQRNAFTGIYEKTGRHLDIASHDFERVYSLANKGKPLVYVTTKVEDSPNN